MDILCDWVLRLIICIFFDWILKEEIMGVDLWLVVMIKEFMFFFRKYNIIWWFVVIDRRGYYGINIINW